MLSITDRQFVQAHLHDDLHRLLLSAHRFPGVSVPAAVAQIEALRKVRTKIPTWFRFDLDLPPLLSVEQASSETTARFKANLFSGRQMADLTGGMGVDAYFFAQRFEQVVYVERQPVLAAAARHNFAMLGASNIRVVEAEALDFLMPQQGSDGVTASHPVTTADTQSRHRLDTNSTPLVTGPKLDTQNSKLDTQNFFDLIYLDPARRDDRQRRVFQLDDCEPNVLRLQDLLLQKAERVLLKTAPLLDLNQAVAQLKTVERIWVVSVENEVKEVLYLLGKAAPDPDAVPIEAACLGPDTQSFLFTRAGEQAAVPAYNLPQGFLYEPDAAVLKAGAFKSFAVRFGLAKLHPNTHLYTSATRVPNVPGRCFAIRAVVKYDRKAVREVLNGDMANVAVRNFPDSTDQVRRKLGLQDGGTWYLFGTTDLEARKVLLLCEREKSLVSKTLN